MKAKNKKKIVIDDGCNPELVYGARFDGVHEIPIIEKPDRIIIPKIIVPFTKRNLVDAKNAALGFNEYDIVFGDVLKDPKKYVESFKEFQMIITIDGSLYTDAPFTAQLINLYRNRALGCYYQRKGVYVIPLIRWGSELTYTDEVIGEKVAFLGAPKDSILAISTYGCIEKRIEKYHFKEGLRSMLETLTPKVVLVYGRMPDAIFKEFKNRTKFVQYDDWITLKHKEKTYGQ